jgi:hypothetical protein
MTAALASQQKVNADEGAIAIAALINAAMNRLSGKNCPVLRLVESRGEEN